MCLFTRPYRPTGTVNREPSLESERGRTITTCRWRKRHEVLAAAPFCVFHSWVLIECAISVMSHMPPIQCRSTLTFSVTYSQRVAWWVILHISCDDLPNAKSLFSDFCEFYLFIFFFSLSLQRLKTRKKAFLPFKWFLNSETYHNQWQVFTNKHFLGFKARLCKFCFEVVVVASLCTFSILPDINHTGQLSSLFSSCPVCHRLFFSFYFTKCN